MQAFSYPSRYPSRFQVTRLPASVILQQQQHPLLADLHATSSGYFPEAHGHHVGRPTLHEYIAIYCVGGRGWYRVQDKEWSVARGDLLFVLRDTPHSYGADPADPWTIHWAHFSGQHAATFLGLAGVSDSAPILPLGERLALVTLFSEILRTLQAGYTLHHLLGAAASLRQLLSRVALTVSYAPPAHSRDVHVEQIIAFMQAHIAAPLTLAELAAEAALSPSHFSRRFHDKTGYPPIEYFIRLKIQQACEMLEATDLDISEIAHRLGYDDPYYFSRIFKKIMSTSPTAYRDGPG